jgi:hypothetical protein
MCVRTQILSLSDLAIVRGVPKVASSLPVVLLRVVVVVHVTFIC